jgi:hypothetical protein
MPTIIRGARTASPAGSTPTRLQEDHHDREEERDAEAEQRQGDEGQVALDRRERDDAVAAEGQQELQAAGDGEEGEGRPGAEQDERGGQERRGVALLLAVQRRGDEGAELVEPDRRGRQDADDERDAQRDRELLEGPEGEQVALAARRSAASWATSVSQYGFLTKSKTRARKISATTTATARASREMPSRLRNSRRCSIRAIRPSGVRSGRRRTEPAI